MPSSQPSRHLPFHALMRALRAPGCPACELGQVSGERWLRTLFHEFVNDPGVRDRLRAARGFCARHTELAAQIGDHLGLCILQADLLADALGALNARPRDACPCCAAEREAATRGIAVLLDHLGEPDVSAAYRAGDGLCLPHLRQALSGGQTAQGVALAALEREKLQALVAQCELFIAHYAGRRRTEPMGPERDVWRRAGRKLAGG